MDLFELAAKITLDSSALEQGITKAQGLVTTGATAMGTVIGNFATKAVEAVGAFAKESIQTGTNFDSAMSQVAATMGKTTDEIGNLRDFAKEMGSTTKFSATEAAEGMNILAMAGYDADQQIATLPSVLSLASAGALSLADSADYVTGIMAGFSNETLDASTIANTLATVASSAKGDVQSFGEGLSTVAGMANTTGQKMQDMTVALGILGNNNYSASEAGNALSRTLRNLYQPSDTAAKGLKEIGVSAYTAEGEARPLQDVLKDLNSATADMSDQAKNQALSKIFDAATLKTVPALLNNCDSAWDDLSQTIAKSNEGAGSAADMAATQLDNLEGDLTIFKSALEGAQIAVSEKLNPVMREFVQIGTEGLSDVTQAFESEGLEGAMEALGTWLADVAGKMAELLPTIVEGAGQLIGALGEGIISNLPMLMDAAVAIITTIVQDIISALPQVVSAATQIIAQLVSGIGAALPTLIPAAVQAVVTIVQGLVDNLPLLLDAALQLMSGLAEGITAALPVITESLPQIIETIVTFLTENTPAIIEAGVALFVALIENLSVAIQTIVAALPQIITALVNAFAQSSPQIAQAGVDLFIALIDNLAEIIATIIEAVPQIVTGIVNAFIDHRGDLVEAGKNLLLGLKDGIISAAETVIEAARGVAENIAGAVKGFFQIESPSKLFREYGRYLDEGLALGIAGNTGVIDSAVDRLTASADLSRADLTVPMSVTSSIQRTAQATETSGGAASNEVLELLREIRDSGTNVYLQGDAAGVFKLVRQENVRRTRATGYNALAMA